MDTHHVLNTEYHFTEYEDDERRPLAGQDRKRALFFFEQDFDLVEPEPLPTRRETRGDLVEMLKECIAELAAGGAGQVPAKGPVFSSPVLPPPKQSTMTKKIVNLTASEDCDMVATSEDEEDPDPDIATAQVRTKYSREKADAEDEEDALELPSSKKAKYAYI